MSTVRLSGPVGWLEGRYAESPDPFAPIALVLHPHPNHGGTMNNKVVYALFDIFKRCQFSVMRFNFRGVGRSQGQAEAGEGELNDAASALDWLQNQNQSARGCWIAGYSFGAWVGLHLLMRRPEIDGFIIVAPPVTMFDFSFLAPCPSRGLVISAKNDELVSEESTNKLVKLLSAQRGLCVTHEVIHRANHSFQGRIETMSKKAEAYLIETQKRIRTEQKLS